MENIKELLADSPVIAAVKDDFGLKKALASECQVIFLLYGNLMTVGELVRKIREAGKIAIVHIDLVEGLSNREIAVDALLKLSHPDGIISTRAGLIRRGKALGLTTIQRAFMIDSLSLQSLLTQMDTATPDFVEILPGIIPGIIRELTGKLEVPIIAGGLIRSKQDVLQALNAGVIAVSTTAETVWKM